MSMRSSGANFREELNYLGTVRGELFGTKSEKMLIQKGRLSPDVGKRADVSIGERKVIESAAPKK